jgi:predicted nuclease of predicted toxin-antitoxin system
MKILLDECLPRKLKNELAPHECQTVPDEGWSELANGELLTTAERSGFELFLTIDRGIEYQQNLSSRHISVVLISSKSNRLADLQRQVPDILRLLKSLLPGQLVKVGPGLNS